uniref:BUB1 mitotic checkpoint serine/threonine kinase n=2 Tax=Echeneis naucrates TaxID=173247 RepID=A0A665VRW5_ECHNA
MSVVFDTLVQKFLNVERYADDIRYVNYCIKCASYYSDPIALYSHIFNKGVGTRSAALYVAWAQQFEQRGLNEQANAVYQKAVENQAQPVDTVLHEYRQFQTRTRSQTGAGGRNPLQNSNLANQMSSHRETATQSKTTVEPLSNPPAVKTTIIVSRSETSGTVPSSHGSNIQTVSEYIQDELVCEGSEFSFEEVRAAKYFRRLRERQEKEHREMMERCLKEHEEGIRNMESMLEKLDHNLQAYGGLTGQRMPAVDAAPPPNPNPTQQALGHPRPSNRPSSRRSLGLRLHSDPTFIQEAATITDPPQHPVDTNALHSEVSYHSSVLHLPKSAATSVSTDQAPVVQSLHRPSSVSAVTSEAAVQPSSWQSGQQQEQNTTHPNVSQSELEDRLDGGTANLSHVTPNTSLGYVQATPSRVLPSPTVNTREALDVIMDMFQAPTLLEDPFNNTSSVLHTAERECDAGYPKYGAAPTFTNPPTSALFTIFQDEDDKENGGAAAAAAKEKPKPIRALAEIPVSKSEKPNDTPSDLMPDESTMWGARYNSLHSLAACPNSTTDFAMLAHCVSTPFTHKSSLFFQDQENNCTRGEEADEDAFIRRQTKKLSPIMEQSPSDDILPETSVAQHPSSSARQGTFVGEELAISQHYLTSSSVTMVQHPPPAVLSFRDQTLCVTDSSVPRTTAPAWEVYTSPEKPSGRTSLVSVGPSSEPFKILEDNDLGEPAGPEQAQKPAYDVAMSPECALKPDWLAIRSPEVTVEPDLDAFMSPCWKNAADSAPNKTQDVPMSPDCALKPDWQGTRIPESTVDPDLGAFQSPERPQLCADVPMSPMQLLPLSAADEPMMSPDRLADVSMNATAKKPGGTESVQLVSDPWDNELISDLLSALSPPLTSHPRCITWQCKVPNITPKMTISMGKASLQVDCVLGEGAFATVYQATDPRTSERMVLKVQKPANPWEFYINTQLDARLQPAVRHLYSGVRSAHLFHDGSVLLCELHNYGTLLNAVNMYKTLSDKVMPQPLVMYFTVCILHMVEQLHSVHIIHADIKPDNFLLGERFLDNKCFDVENLDHGLVLIDLGQSVDMELFPEGTAFTAKCLTSGFQCTEMLSGKPWNYQTDYFGIAGTVHCMLFGTYMQVTNEDGVWKTNAVFRRNPHSELWCEFFHTLLNVPNCSAQPSLRSLRCKLTSVLQENYGRKLSTLKSRLLVLLLENRKAARR